jgi:hypothetical protein
MLSVLSSATLAYNVLQLPAVGDFWHYSSNISLIPIAIGILPAQIFNNPLNRQLLVAPM